MLRTFLAALLAILSIAPAHAQTFPKPPDVPAYVEVPITYASGTNENCLGGQTLSAGVCTGASDGGTMPVEANALPDVPLTALGYVDDDWTYEGTYGEIDGYKALAADGGTGTEMKARFVLDDTVVLNNDPIRNYGQPGTSHCHNFFGAVKPNAYSTFASLRRDSVQSQASGGPHNGTAYWFPCAMMLNAFGDGRDYVAKPNGIVIYYEEHPSKRGKIQRLPLGARYVTGFHMDDGWTWMQSKIDTANAQPGTANRYRLDNGNGTSRGSGAGIYCTDASNNVTVGKVPNFNEITPEMCPVGGEMIVEFSGARCYDGVNLWSPGGYKHVVPEVWDSVKSDWVCPQGWYRIASLQLKIHYSHEGYGAGPRNINNWRYSCHGMGAAVNITVVGESCFHTDWFGAWSDFAWTTWNRNCLGDDGFQPHECDTSTISSTRRLIYASGAPTGRDPQVKLTKELTTNDPTRITRVPFTSAGAGHDLHVIRDNNMVIAEGDSITADSGSFAGAYKAARLAYVVHHSTVATGYGAYGGVGLIGTNSPTSRLAATIAANPKVVTILIGANDLGSTVTYPTTQDFIDALWAYTDPLRAAGIKVAVATILPQYLPSNPTFQASHNSRRATVNAAIRAAVGTHIDAYIDFAATSIGDEDADAQNTTYYNSDGVHLTAAGYDVLDPVYAGVVDRLMGYQGSALELWSVLPVNDDERESMAA